MRKLTLFSLLVALSLIPALAKDTAHSNTLKQLKVTTPEPKTALEHNNRGVELATHGLWEESIREHNIALLEDPTNRTFRRNLSSAYLQYGNLLMDKRDGLSVVRAVAQFHRALYIDPNNKAAADRLNSLPDYLPAKPKGNAPMPTQKELDEFLSGKGKMLHGYDAVDCDVK